MFHSQQIFDFSGWFLRKIRFGIWDNGIWDNVRNHRILICSIRPQIMNDLAITTSHVKSNVFVGVKSSINSNLFIAASERKRNEWIPKVLFNKKSHFWNSRLNFHFLLSRSRNFNETELSLQYKNSHFYLKWELKVIILDKWNLKQRQRSYTTIQECQ